MQPTNAPDGCVGGVRYTDDSVTQPPVGVTIFIEVIADIPARAVDRPFTYRADEPVQVGSYVAVDFGGRVVGGYVVATDVADPSAADPSIVAAPIRAVLGGPFFTGHAYPVARWIADTYAAPVSECVRLFSPPGHSFKVRPQGDTFTADLPSARPSMERWAHLLVPAGEITVRAGAHKQRAVVEALAGGPASVASLSAEIGPINSTIATLRTMGYVGLEERRRFRSVGDHTSRTGAHVRRVASELTEGQAHALAELGPAIERRDGGVYVLDGVTGSGKTEVYLQLIERVLEEGGGAIVLVPEISLTPQTVSRFRERFGDSVAVLHSRLSDGERLDQWDLIRTGECRVVVGARSALFSPVSELRLIVIDEEHDTSYKQGSSPRYHARDVAERIADSTGATLVLGSATPSLESLARVGEGAWSLLSMPERVNGASLPAVTVVDLTDEFASGNRSVFSAALVRELEQVREAGQKAVLLLNRRGYASFLLCRECGYVPSCDSCSTSMTYHETANHLRCHQCNAIAPVPGRCPECQSPYIRQFGAGTQRVEAELSQRFSGWPVVRMDADTTTGKRSHEDLLAEFRGLPSGVLLGTQMIAKGHDFPEVTLVGVISADTTLHLPDFLASERTYQLLAQVAGRAGRGREPGRVVIQTYWPDHPAIVAVAQHDRARFIDIELGARRELRYPPFARLANIVLSGPDQPEVAAFADSLAVALRGEIASDECEVLGPAPCAISRAKRQYRHHLMVKAPRGYAVGAAIRAALAHAKPPKGVSVSVDVDPTSLA